MSEEEAKAMNEMTVAEARLLYITCGLEAITGNGQLCAMVSENEAEETEIRRCQHGF